MTYSLEDKVSELEDRIIDLEGEVQSLEKENAELRDDLGDAHGAIIEIKSITRKF